MGNVFCSICLKRKRTVVGGSLLEAHEDFDAKFPSYLPDLEDPEIAEIILDLSSASDSDFSDDEIEKLVAKRQ